MKKYKKAIIVAVLIIALIAWIASAFADSSASSIVVQAVSLNGLGVSNPGLLPSNPFYFSEEWIWDVQKIFTTDQLSSSKLELQILNNKAAELLGEFGLNPTDNNALSVAITNYGNELQVMDTDLQAISIKSADIDSFLSDLTGKLLLHYEILEEIKAENGDSNGTISAIQSHISKIVYGIPGKMSDSGQFGAMVDGAISSQTDDLGIELRSIPFVDGVEFVNADPSVRSQLDQIRQDQVLQFEGRFDANGLPVNIITGLFAQLPVSNLDKLRLIDDLREFVIDSSLKSELDSIRANLLDQLAGGTEVTSGDVAGLIGYANTLINQTSAIQQSYVKELAQADSLLAQANNDTANGLYAVAFGETDNAISIIDGVLINSELDKTGIADSASALSDQLSALETTANNQDLTRTDDPKLFALFDTISQILSNNPSPGDIYQVREYTYEINFALNNTAAGVPSALIPVPTGSNANNTVTSGLSFVAQTNGTQYCPEYYEPVCGSDGTTYPNKCFSELVGISVSYRGECVQSATSTQSATTSASAAH